ncbi:hypothetical protein [Thermomonas mangrovi]|uniref:hypothetical protein n=1 Tax=Thermomonas mangrovi TaxID=2993316 RepID=UPI0023078E92|nr:hypothetical protein [Thermomonas mangrovi]
MRYAARALVLALLLCGSAVAADKVTKLPVHFAKGASSATLKGNFSGYDSVQYTIGARAGQTMTVSITGSSNANFNVFAPGHVPGQSEAMGSGFVGSPWSGKLPANGTYTVQVFQMRASARRGEAVPYTIKIGVAGGASAAAPAGGNFAAARTACLKAVAAEVGVAQSKLSIGNVGKGQSGIAVTVMVPGSRGPAPWDCLADERGRVKNVMYAGSDGE